MTIKATLLIFSACTAPTIAAAGSRLLPTDPTDIVLHHYVVVRSDLPPGVALAQTIHAAGESASLCRPPPGTHAVALQADAQQLRLLADRLRTDSIPHSLIAEPDSPYFGELVAIGLVPQPRTDRLRRLMRPYRLVR